MPNGYDPYGPRPHQTNRHRFLVFVPKEPTPDVPVIYDVSIDANLNCARCGTTLIAFEAGRGMQPKDGVLNDKERRVRCPHCEAANAKEARKTTKVKEVSSKTKQPSKSSASPASPRKRRRASTKKKKT